MHLCSGKLHFLHGKILDCMVYVLVDFVLYGLTFVNCLLNAFALSMSVMAVLIPNRMLLFCCVGFFLLNSFGMVPHRECGLCL